MNRARCVLKKLRFGVWMKSAVYLRLNKVTMKYYVQSGKKDRHNKTHKVGNKRPILLTGTRMNII